MASNLLLIVLLILFSVSVTSVYSLSTRDHAVSKQDDESYFMATTGDQDVGDLAKARSLQALVAESKVVVNKKSESSKKKKHNKKKVLALVKIIILCIALTTVIICMILVCFLKYKSKKLQSTGHERINKSSSDHV